MEKDAKLITVGPTFIPDYRVDELHQQKKQAFQFCVRLFVEKKEERG